MADLANEFVQFLKAIKAKDETAVTKHGTKVMGLYATGALADDNDKAVATIIDKADGESAFEFLAQLID